MRKRLLEISIFLIAIGIFVFANLPHPRSISPIENLQELDVQYLETMRAYDNEYLNAISNEALLGAAKNICSDFMYGYSLDEVINLRLTDNSEESRLVFGYIVLNGTKIFCPDYQDYVEEFTW